MNSDLRRDGNGDWATAATTVTSTFSGGGSGAAAKVDAGGLSTGFGFGAKLPAPDIDGSTATYRNVLPDIDLIEVAGDDGFSLSLRLRTRPTRPVTFTLPLKLTGLTATQDPATGALTLTDGSGTPVFRTAQPIMYDGARDPHSDEPLHSAVVDTQLINDKSGSRIVVTPDWSFLSDPDVTYPVTIDPDATLDEVHYTFTSSEFSTTSYWDNTITENGTTGILHVGTYNSGTDRNRGYYRFNTSTIVGHTITSATFRAKETWAWSCNAREVDVYEPNDNVTSSTTWATQPGLGTKLDAVSVAKGWSSSCPAGTVDFDVTSAVKGWANDASGAKTLSLVAADNFDNYYWKKFAGSSGKVLVNFANVPTAPGSVSATPGDQNVSVTWTAPSSNGGSAITAYHVTYLKRVVNAPDTVVYQHDVPATSRSDSRGGLINGQDYRVEVEAKNSEGAGPATNSGYVTPSTYPSAVRNLTLGGGNNRVFADWDAPVDNGGLAVDKYLAYLYPAGSTWPGSNWIAYKYVTAGTSTYFQAGDGSTCNGGGTCPPANGTAYDVVVFPHNTSPQGAVVGGIQLAAGFGPPTTSSNATAQNYPSAPQNLTLSPGDGHITVSWTPPVDTGGPGVPISYYIVGLYPAGSAYPDTTSLSAFPAADQRSVTISGATNGTPYTAYVWARNASIEQATTNGSTTNPGVSPAAIAGPATPAGIPGTPANVTAGNTDASGNTVQNAIIVSWDSPSNNGAPITAYHLRRYVCTSGASSSCTLDASGNVTAYPNGQNGRQYSPPITPILDGYYAFDVQADNTTSGNPDTGTSAWSAMSMPYLYNATGPGAPVITSPDHAQDTWSPSSTATFAWTATSPSAPVVGYSVVFDETLDTIPGTTVNDVAPTWQQQNISDGTHYLHVRAKDAGGRWGPTGTYRVLVDATAPAAPAITSSTQPDENTWYSASDATFAFPADDTSGIAGYSYLIDHQPATTPDTTSEGSSATASMSGLADGVWYFHVRAQNGAGLWGATSTYKVMLDATAPTPPAVTSPDHNTTDAINQPVVTTDWSNQPGTDATSGIAGYSYTWNNSAGTAADLGIDTTATQVSSGTLSDGTWYFHLRAVDQAGNPSTDVVFGPVTISQSAPPVGDTDRDRFIQLWKPRVYSDTFYQDYFAYDGYPPEILAEGFHSMTNVQQHYLADQLWEAIKADRPTDPELDTDARQVIYEFVFDKDKQAHPADPRKYDDSDSTSRSLGEDISQPLPASVTELLDHSGGFYTSPADLPVAPPPVEGISEIPLDVPDLPDIPQTTIRSLLDPQTTQQLTDLATPGNPLDEATSLLQVIDNELGLSLDDTPVFGLPDQLPINYTICWDAANNDNCTTGHLLNVDQDIDITGDGTSDLTVTFGPSTGALPSVLAGDLVNLRLEVRRYQPLLPGVQPDSDLKGQPLPAHAWIVYDVPDPVNGTAAGTRLKLGFDGYVRGETLSEDTTLDLGFPDLTSIANHDITADYRLTHTWPDSTKPQWALTIGTEQLTGDPDPTDAALTYSNAVGQTGTFETANDDGVDGAINRRVAFSTDTSGPHQLTAKIDDTVAALNQTTSARVVLTDLPAGTSVTYARSQDTAGGADHQTVDLTNNQDSTRTLPRAAGIYQINDTTTDKTTFDLRNVPGDTHVTGVRTTGSQFDYTYEANAASGAAAVSLRRIDDQGHLQLAGSFRSTSLPTSVHAVYGPSEQAGDDRTMLVVTSSTGFDDLQFSGYDANLGLTITGDATDVPTSLIGSASASGDNTQFSADGGSVGSLHAVLSRNGGSISRHSGPHATLVEQGNAVGASLRIYGLTSAEMFLSGDTASANLGLADATSNPNFTVAANFDGPTLISTLDDLPASTGVNLTLTNPADLELITSSRISHATFYGRLPGGVITDGALSSIPTHVTLTAGLNSDDASVDYTANGDLDAIDRAMFSTDNNPGDASGTTVKLTAATLSRHLTGSASLDAHHVEFRALDAQDNPSSVGHLSAQISRKGVAADTPIGQHLTLRGTADAWALSADIDHLASATGGLAADLHSGTAQVRLDQPTGPFTLHYDMDNLRIFAATSNLPSAVDVTADTTNPTLSYTGSERLDQVDLYGARTDTGPTIRGRLEGAPASATLQAVIGNPTVSVDYNASGGTHRAAGYYSPTYVARGLTPATDFVSADARATQNSDGTYSAVPATFHANLDTDTDSLHWRDADPVGEIRVRGQGAFLHNFTVSGLARGVPGNFDATFAPGQQLFDGLGATIDYLDVQASNHAGLPNPLPGRHLKALLDLNNGNADISAALDNVSHASVETGDHSVTVTGGADLQGAQLDTDVVIDGLLAGTSDDAFRVKLYGTINELPSSMGVTVHDNSLDYDASDHLTGELHAKAGWTTAIADAPTPAGRAGVSITDGACDRSANSSGCPDSGTGTTFMCTDSQCFALDAVIKDDQPLPKHLTVTADPTADLPLLTVGGLAAGTFSAKADIDDLTAHHIVANFTQSGIPAGADLTIGPIDLTRTTGGPSLHLHATGSTGLGSLGGSIRIPDDSFGYGGTADQHNYIITAPHATVDIGQLPRDLDVIARFGGQAHLAVFTSDPLPSISAQLDTTLEQADGNGGYETVSNPSNPKCPDYPNGRFCGDLTLTNLPAAPYSAGPGAQPITLDASTGTDQLQGDGGAIPAFDLSYAAPASGADLRLNLDPGLLVLADGSADLVIFNANGDVSARFGEIGFAGTDIGATVEVSAATGPDTLTVSSAPTPATNLSAFTSEVQAVASGGFTRSFPGTLPGSLNLASLAVKVDGTFTFHAIRPRVTFTGLSTATLTRDQHELAIGVDGNYDTMRLDTDQTSAPTLTASGLAVTPGVSANPALPWIPDFFGIPISIPVPDLTVHDFAGVVLKADTKGTLFCLTTGFGGFGDQASIKMRPDPSNISDHPPKDAIVLNGSDGRQIFTFDPGGPNRLTAKGLALLAATVWNPYNNTDVDIDFGPFSC